MQPRLLRSIYAALALALLAALAVYAWRGTYTRYITDDFCSASKLKHLGLLESMKWHRTHWTGRYSYYAVKAVPESIGPATAPVVPALMIAFFCASAVWTMRRITDDALLAAMTGMGIVFATIDATDEVLGVVGPLLWETGVLTYMLPLVLYTLWLGVFFAPRSLAVRCILSALLMFAAGGLSETTLAAQAGLTGGVLFLTLVRRTPDGIRIAAAGFVATLLSAFIATTAPGNVIRMAELPPQQPLPDAILHALRLAARFIGSNVFLGGAALVALLACGVVLGRTRNRSEIPTILLLALIGLGAFVASLLPSAWMFSASPPPRALHVSTFFFGGVLFALAAALGAARPHLARVVAPVLLTLSIPIALYSAGSVWRTFDEGRRHAAEVDRIAAIMRTSAGKDVVIRSPYALAMRLLARDPNYWTNQCICDYYGARSVTVTR